MPVGLAAVFNNHRRQPNVFVAGAILHVHVESPTKERCVTCRVVCLGFQEMAALLQRVMAGREEQKKQRQMDLERLLQRSVRNSVLRVSLLVREEKFGGSIINGKCTIISRGNTYVHTFGFSGRGHHVPESTNDSPCAWHVYGLWMIVPQNKAKS